MITLILPQGCTSYPENIGVKGLSFDTDTIASAIQGLASQDDRFYRWIASHSLCCTQIKQGAADAPLSLNACLKSHEQDMKIRIEPVMRGAASGGKAVFGLTLLGLSFVPGGAGGASLASTSNLTRQLIGTAASFALQHALTEQISPQHYADIGTDPSSQVTPPSHAAQGGVIPLVYGQVLMESMPVISSSLTVETHKL